ncbi:hypothetical protein [Acidithrix ferrooxidans]|uniref:hypothetical protein n=1 Tax=Acidithrix ferrooxidans TaxID=1280514 RepID=UPI0006970155|nr:hypothetical protein [Acidithrix ferrooxidans]
MGEPGYAYLQLLTADKTGVRRDTQTEPRRRSSADRGRHRLTSRRIPTGGATTGGQQCLADSEESHPVGTRQTIPQNQNLQFFHLPAPLLEICDALNFPQL